MSDTEQPQEPKQPEQGGGMMSSVSMAFNLGVSAIQQGAPQGISALAAETKDSIFQQLKTSYGDQLEDSFLEANAEYLTQVAMLGYIIPSICAFDEGFKDRLFQLIQAKLEKKNEAPPQSTQSSNIIVP